MILEKYSKLHRLTSSTTINNTIDRRCNQNLGKPRVANLENNCFGIMLLKPAENFHCSQKVKEKINKTSKR